MPRALPGTNQDSPTGVVILPRLPLEHVADAAALLLEAFEAKLAPLAGRGAVGQRVVAASLNPARFLTAMADGRLVGLCGVRWRGSRRGLSTPIRALAREFGWLRALPRWAALSMGHRAVPRRTLYVDHLAVAADARGRGIGTALLTAAVALARQQGFGQLRLDVVDTNPRARALYERLGFVALRTQRTPFLRRWLGFGAVTRMEKRM